MCLFGNAQNLLQSNVVVFCNKKKKWKSFPLIIIRIIPCQYVQKRITILKKNTIWVKKNKKNKCFKNAIYEFVEVHVMSIDLSCTSLYFCIFILIVINCTLLTKRVDQEGPLRMSNCSNHFGAKCNFSCSIGYRLNGSSTVTCVAPGNQHPGVWNNTLPTCEGKLYIAVVV